MELKEKLEKLIPVGGLQSAATACSEATVRSLNRLINHAEDLCDVAVKSGVTGTRALLKDLVREIRASISAEFERLAAAGAMPAGEKDAKPDGN